MAVSIKMKRFASQSSWIRKMFEEGAKMRAMYGAENVFDFSLGNPDLPPPPRFNQVLQQIANEQKPNIHSYMPNSGYPQVRSAVAGQVSLEQGIVLKKHEIIMTCGAAGALNVVMKALLDPGDEVIILAPFFVEYNFYVDNHGGVAKIVSTAADFTLDLDAISKALSAKTKAVIINSPNNPTGQIYSTDELIALGTILEAANRKSGVPIYLVADEPYRKIIYDNHQVPTIFKIYRNTIVVSSWSKELSLPGERIGYIAVHPEIDEKDDLLDAMILANRILGFVNAPALMQRVIEQLVRVTVDCAAYSRRRQIFCDILMEAGYEFIPPKGAFYLFPKSPIADDVRFIKILTAQKILAVPGRGFGMPGYFRLAFCVEEAVIKRAAIAFKQAMDVAVS